MKTIFNEKFMEILQHEGAVSVVTLSEIGVNVSNTWNSYLRIPRDGKLLIPASGMKKTDKNVELTLSKKNVRGLWGMGSSFYWKERLLSYMKEKNLK